MAYPDSQEGREARGKARRSTANPDHQYAETGRGEAGGREVEGKTSKEPARTDERGGKGETGPQPPPSTRREKKKKKKGTAVAGQKHRAN